MKLRIRNWKDNFENAKSRTIRNCQWIPIPNRWDGARFNQIIAMEDGAAIFGIWILIVQLCSRQTPPRDGWLTDNGRRDGRARTVAELATLLRRPETEILRAISILSGPQVEWIENAGKIKDTAVPRRGTEVPCEGMKELKELKEGTRESNARMPPERPQDRGFVHIDAPNGGTRGRGEAGERKGNLGSMARRLNPENGKMASSFKMAKCPDCECGWEGSWKDAAGEGGFACPSCHGAMMALPTPADPVLNL